MAILDGALVTQRCFHVMRQGMWQNVLKDWTNGDATEAGRCCCGFLAPTLLHFSVNGPNAVTLQAPEIHCPVEQGLLLSRRTH